MAEERLYHVTTNIFKCGYCGLDTTSWSRGCKLCDSDYSDFLKLIKGGRTKECLP